MANTEGPRVKGIAFKSVMRALETLHGEAVAATCLASLPTDLAQAFRYGQILASTWYPIEWYRQLLKAVQAAAGLRERGTFEIGRQCTRQDMTGIYKIGFKLVSPETVLSLSTRLFSNYYDTGGSRILESRRGFARAEWTGCVGFDKNMWWEAFGGAQMFMELAGAGNIRTRLVRGGEDKDDFCEVTMHWTEGRSVATEATNPSTESNEPPSLGHLGHGGAAVTAGEGPLATEDPPSRTAQVPPTLRSLVPQEGVPSRRGGLPPVRR